MIFKIVPDENAQEVAFVNGEVDFLEISTYDALQKYEADDTVTVIKYPEGRVNNMAINAFSLSLIHIYGLIAQLVRAHA